MVKKGKAVAKSSSHKVEKPKKVSKTEEKTEFNFNVLGKPWVRTYLLPAVLILIVMWFAFFIRSGPITLDGLEDNVRANTYNQIQNIILNNINNQYPDINPAYKQELLDKEYNKVLQTGKYELNGQTIVIEDVVSQNVEQVKEAFKAENGQTYLNAIDPYHFYRQAELYHYNGYVGDTLKENENGELVPYLTYKLAPNGIKGTENPDFHTWLEAMFMKIAGVDESSGVGEKTAAVYLIPVIFAMLSVIPAFLIIRKFSNDWMAFFGSLLLVSIGTYVSRTVAGFVDTDAYNVFFPLAIVALILYSFVYKDKILTVILAALAGIFQGLFIWSWGSGWFIFVFLVASLGAYLGYLVIVNLLKKTKVKELASLITNDILVLGTYIVSSFAFVYLFAKTNLFSLAYGAVFSSLSNIASISRTNIWPNVYSSVAELNPASFSTIVSSVGGKIIFLVALLGLLLMALDFKSRNRNFQIADRLIIAFAIIWWLAILFGNFLVFLTANQAFVFLAALALPVGLALFSSLMNHRLDNKVFIVTLLTIWVMGTIYMSLNGVRFILLLAPAFAVSFGYGLYYISRFITEFISNEFVNKHKEKKDPNGMTGLIAVSVLFFVLFIPIAQGAISISKGTTPNFDDAWYSTMYKIQNNSQEDAIITSWWDFGHFFAAISKRGVTFDGGSQTTPQAHWVGKLLLENDEQVSKDILKMLVCGGNNAFDYILKTTEDNTNGVKTNQLIYSTFGKSDEEKIQLLNDYKYYDFTSDEIDEVMSRLSCENPPENFLITSEDMVGKAAVWAHWGMWDFTKKYVYDNYQSKTPQEIATELDGNLTLVEQYVNELNAIDQRSQSENIKRMDLVNQWFAPYPSYIPIQGSYTYPCSITNTSINCQNGVSVNVATGEVSSQFGDQVTFNDLVYPTSAGTLQVVDQGDGEVDVVLIPSSSGYNVLLAQAPLGNSLFTKLFYLDGYGTTGFEKFDDVQSLTGVRVKTWKVNWTDAPQISSGINVSDVVFEENDSNSVGNSTE